MIEYEVLLNQDRQPYIEVIREHADKTYVNSGEIAELMQEMYNINSKATEYVHLVCFDNAMHLLGIQEISHGSVNVSLFPIREIMTGALLCGASNIIVTHNHPSGIAKPSREDIASTNKIKDAGEILGIRLQDHVITGKEGYYSFKEQNII